MRTVPTGLGHQLVEVWPTHCRNRHRLGPGKVLGYFEQTRGRIIRCDRCGDEQDERIGYLSPV